MTISLLTKSRTCISLGNDVQYILSSTLLASAQSSGIVDIASKSSGESPPQTTAMDNKQNEYNYKMSEHQILDKWQDDTHNLPT